MEYVQGRRERPFETGACERDEHEPSGGRLLDHLIRSPQRGVRDRQPECLRGLEVDDQVELGGLLYRQVARLGTLFGPVAGPRAGALRSMAL